MSSQAIIDQILADNLLCLSKTPDGQSSLMKAVSQATFQRVDYFDTILKYCQKYLKNLSESKKLTSKLESLIQSEQWLADYMINPSMKCFDRLQNEIQLSQSTKPPTLYEEKPQKKRNTQTDDDLENIYSTIQMSIESDNQPTILATESPQELEQNEAKQSALLEQNEVLDNSEIGNMPASNPIASSSIQPTQSHHRQSFSRRHKKSLSDTFNPFQVRVPSEYLDFFRGGSNDFSKDSASFLAFQASTITPQQISLHNSNPIDPSSINTSNNMNSNTNNQTPINGFQYFPQQLPELQSKRIKSMIAAPSAQADESQVNEEFLGLPKLTQNHSAVISSGNSNVPGMRNTLTTGNMYSQNNSNINNNSNNINSNNSNNNHTNNLLLLNNPSNLIEDQMHGMNASLNLLAPSPVSLEFFPNLLQPIMNQPLNLLTTTGFGDLSGMSSNAHHSNHLHHHLSLHGSNQTSQSTSSSVPSMGINENLRRYMGSLKFFDENKNYGFIVMDDDNRDIFVHYDDLQKAGITKEFLKSSKQGNVIRFSFSCMQYIGKYKQSKKAVELQVMPYNPALSAMRMQQQFSYIYAKDTNNNNNSNHGDRK